MTPEALGFFGGFGVLFLPMKASEKKIIGSNDPIPFIFPGKKGLFVYRGMVEPQINHIDKKKGAGGSGTQRVRGWQFGSKAKESLDRF